MANLYLIAGCCGILLLINFEFQPVHAQRNGDLRFAGPGSTNYQGRVEIFYQGLWGTVCDDAFGTTEAQTVCRQMGFSREVIAGAQFITKRFAPGTGPIWLDDVECDAAPEIARLVDCQFNGWNSSDCVHEEDIGVICPQTTVTTRAPALTTTAQATVGPNPGICTNPYPYVRLMSPGNASYGVVQVFNTGTNEWGTLCDDTWELLDARVICRMMCYDQNNALPGAPPFNKRNIIEPMTVRDVHCTGQEASITDCRQSAWAHNSCEATEKALVTCTPLDNGASSKPAPDLLCTDGLLTARFSTIWDPDLVPRDLTVDNVPPGVPCNVQYQTGTNFVSIAIPFDECDVQRTYNATHIFYNSVIQYEQTQTTGDISYGNTFQVYVLCCLPRDLIADRPIFPIVENVTQKAEALFQVSMHFFDDSNFRRENLRDPVEIVLGEYVNMALKLVEVDPELVMVVHNCYATPSANRNHAVRYDLFIDKCAVDPTLSDFQFNNTFVGFRWKMFRFVNFIEVHIHCEVLVCGQEEKDTSQECDRSCFTQQYYGGRKKRSIEDHTVLYVEGPTIIVIDKGDAEESTQDPLPANTEGSDPIRNPSAAEEGNQATTKGQLPVTNEPTTDFTLDITTAAQAFGNEKLVGASDANSLTSFTAIWCLCCLTGFLSFVL